LKRLVAGFAFGLLGCASPHGTGPLAAPALMGHVARLSDPELEGRDAGTDGERKAAEYVKSEPGPAYFLGHEIRARSMAP
jgi:hypothetical protein